MKKKVYNEEEIIGQYEVKYDVPSRVINGLFCAKTRFYLLDGTVTSWEEVPMEYLDFHQYAKKRVLELNMKK